MQTSSEFNFRVHILNLNKSSHTVEGNTPVTSIRRLSIPTYKPIFYRHTEQSSFNREKACVSRDIP